MISFDYEGKTYRLTGDQANHACDNDSLIRLPDGTLLQTGGWLESYPPQLVDAELTKVSVVQATSDAVVRAVEGD